jgi:GT2 family glycosyltransferase
VLPEIAVVVGNHQGEHLLRDCLESLASQTRPPREILVVDGASTDRSQEIAEELGARFLPTANHGLGFLYNLGAQSTSCDYVLCSNNDVAYESGCLELLAAALDADTQRFATDPTQLDWPGTEVIHARTRLRRGRFLREYLPGLHLDYVTSADAIVPTVSAHGAAMLVRRSQLLELGGFDESFFMDWEDVDLCWRAWLRGWPSVYVPQARLRHRVGAATGKATGSRRRASSHHNLVRFALKCLPRAEVARVIAGELLYLPRHPRSTSSGLFGVLRELSDILRLRRSLRPSARVFDELLAL